MRDPADGRGFLILKEYQRPGPNLSSSGTRLAHKKYPGGGVPQARVILSANSTSCRLSCTDAPGCSPHSADYAQYRLAVRDRSSGAKTRSTCSEESPSSGLA